MPESGTERKKKGSIGILSSSSGGVRGNGQKSWGSTKSEDGKSRQ